MLEYVSFTYFLGTQKTLGDSPSTDLKRAQNGNSTDVTNMVGRSI